MPNRIKTQTMTYSSKHRTTPLSERNVASIQIKLHKKDMHERK